MRNPFRSAWSSLALRVLSKSVGRRQALAGSIPTGFIEWKMRSDYPVAERSHLAE
jgi:hypothetical protein